MIHKLKMCLICSIVYMLSQLIPNFKYQSIIKGLDRLFEGINFRFSILII